MCNLSEGIWEEALLEGETKGKAEGEAGIIRQMSRKGFTTKDIAGILEREEEEIQAILEGKSILV